MTPLQRHLLRDDARRRQREHAQAQPPCKLQPPDAPYIPPVDGRPGGLIGTRTVIKDAFGRYIEL